MASGSQNTIPKDAFSGCRLFEYELLRGAIPSNTNDIVSLPERHINLDEISEELERKTKETQMLQEEMENATKRTMERIGYSFTNNSTPSQLGHMPMVFMDGSSEDNSDILSSCRQSVIRPLSYGLDLEVARHGVGFPGKDVLENAIEDYAQQVSELQKQLSETHEQHEQQKFAFRQSIIKLQTKLQEVRMEKDGISDLRMKESRKHADLMGKMQVTIKELQTTKQGGDWRLLEAEDQAKSFGRKAESMARTIQEVYCTLLAYEKRSGHSSHVGEDVAATGQDSLGVAVEKVLQSLEHENHNLQERLLLAEEQLGSQEQKCQGKAEVMMKQQQERMEQRITSHDQEVALLTEKLNSSRSSACSLRVQVELLQKQAESQAVVHQNQISELESALTILRSDLLNAQRGHDIKLEALERQLAQSQAQVEEVQRGRDRSLQQAEELDAQLCQLTSELRQAREELSLEKEQNKQLWERDAGHGAALDSLRGALEERSLAVQQLEAVVGSLREDRQAQTDAQLCAERQQRELQDKLSALRRQLELTTEQLQRGRAEERRLQALAGEREAESKRLRARLDERERELQETQQGRARLQEAQARCQVLGVEAEAMRLQLEDREKVVELLRLQMASATQVTVQHGRSMDSLHEQRSRLGNQLNEHKLEIQQLRTEVDQREARQGVLERERRQQQTKLSEQSRCVRELTLEKQQLTAELEVQRMQLLSLAEELEQLKRLHSSKSEEHEAVVTRLRAQLKATRVELDQARSTLRTLEGADGHGMKVAMGMQKQITAKREQVDSLQSRIQLLEETLEKLSRDKRHQSQESGRQVQELASIREEKRRLAEEAEAMRALERRLRDKVTKLETTLHKMSESFADCQEHIQMQEQEFMRLKLQHALDLKGQSLRSTGSAGQRVVLSGPDALNTPPSSALHGSKPLTELGLQKQRENPTLELRSLVKELRGVISENPGPHTGPTSHPTPASPSCSNSLSRRRSAPESVFTKTTHNEVTKDVTNKMSKEAYSMTTDLEERNERNLNGTFSSESHEVSFAASLPRYTSSPRAAAPGRRSPVHSLLTSDPCCTPPPQNRPGLAGPPTDKHTLVSPWDGLTTHTCTDLQGKLDNLQNMVEDLHMKSQDMSSMIKGQERKMRRVKDRERLYNKQSTE